MRPMYERPPVMPRESAPSYVQVVKQCRQQLEQAQREARRLISIKIYPYDYF